MEPINGKGNFHFYGHLKELSLESTFELNQFDNGLIKISFSLKRNNKNWNKIGDIQNYAYANNIIPFVSLIGEVYNPNGKIVAKELSIDDIKTAPDEENIILGGLKKIEIKYGNYYHRKYIVEVGLTNFDFTNFEVELNDFNISFKHIDDYFNIINQLRKDKKPKLTSIAIIKCKKKRSLDIEIEIKIITKLLSLAVRTDIEEIFEKYSYNGNLYKIILIPNRTFTFVSVYPLIHQYYGSCFNLAMFLETTYLNYKRNYKDFGFDLAFDYYLDSIRSNIIQNKFILGMICLEVILGHYTDLREQNNDPIKNGIMARNRKYINDELNPNEEENVTEKTIDKIVKEVSNPYLTLHEKLTAFLEDKFSIELEQKDRDLAQIRNKIVHTGEFPKSIGEGRNRREIDEIEEIHRLIYLNDRLILRILGYKRKNFNNILENINTATINWEKRLN